MKRTYHQLADSLERGGWNHECDSLGSAAREDMSLAALIDIMCSLRAIRRVLECPNVQQMAIATQSIDRAIRRHSAKKRPRKKAAK